jgi:putative ubiquitin-RnfH superfamily antitoxin RatB of RatAB toxin-antitoxin module
VAANIEVEVAYAKPEKQVILTVKGEAGMTVLEAIRRSGIQEIFPEIDPATARVGIFGKATTQDTVLSTGDRVEIYRELIADPKAARKKKAAAQEGNAV